MLTSIADAIDQMALSSLIKTHFWIVPTVQSIHIIAIALVFTASTVIAMRATGLMNRDGLSIQQWSALLMPGLWWGLLILLLSGLVLIIGEPHRELLSTVFQLKMLGVVIVVLLSLYVAKNTTTENVSRLTLWLSIVLLIVLATVICAGRWIAYI